MHKNLDDTPISSELLLSSTQRGWQGFSADVWAHSEGVLVHKRTSWATDVAIDITGRGGALVERHAPGLRDRTASGRGTIWLCPCFLQETTIRFSAPLPGMLHLRLTSDVFSAAGFGERAYQSLVPLMRYDGGFQDPLIESIGEAILAEMRVESSAGTLLVESLANSLAIRLVQQHLIDIPENALEILKPFDLDRRKIKRVLEYIDANVEASISLDDLAAIACMSRFHFARVFKLATGRPPYRYVSEKRFERARCLLGKNERSIDDIASALGFSSASNFSRAFRQFTGLSPREFRERPG